MSLHPLRLAVLDVGQGDTIVVSCPATREAIVVDCINEHAVLDYLRSQDIQKVRALILTHLHSDHYRRAVAFLRNCERQLRTECERVIVSTPFPARIDLDDDAEPYPNEFRALETWMLENEDRVHSVPQGGNSRFEAH